MLAILQAVQTQSEMMEPAAAASALTSSAPPYPSLAKLGLAECGCGSLDVLDEAAQVFAGNK